MKKFDSKTKTMTKRILSGSHVLLVSDQGDVGNYETMVWRGDRRARRWVSVDTVGARAKQALILGADSLSLDKNRVLVRSGTKTTSVEGEELVVTHDSMKKPEGTSFTIDSWRGENRDAVRALYSTIGTDESLPTLATVWFSPENSTTVKAISSDRFRATWAKVETTSKPVDFEAQVRRFLIRELTFNSAWHLTVWKGYATAEFCETGVRVQTMNFEPSEAGFPKIENQFTESRSDYAEWMVTPELFGRGVRKMNPPHRTPVALSRDGLIAAEGTGEILPVGVVSTGVVGKPVKWVALSPEYLAQMMQALSRYDEVSLVWGEHMKPVTVRVSKSVEQIIMPVRSTGNVFPVANISEF